MIKINYLVLINKTNLIDDSYFKELNLITVTDILGKAVNIEKATFNYYSKLKEFLFKNIKVHIEISSAFRSFNEQRSIIDDCNLNYGLDYINKYVAPVGASEHHTGLAIDLGLIVSGKKCLNADEAFKYEDIFKKIHKYLKDFGFILRYPKGKENITGYVYEPWHIRYVGDVASKNIYNNGLTLEEYVLKHV